MCIGELQANAPSNGKDSYFISFNHPLFMSLRRLIMQYIIYMLMPNMVPVILLKTPLNMLFVLIFILMAPYFIQSYPNKL